MPLEATRSSAIVWCGRGLASLIDQALFSGSQFVVSILLARWLAIAEFGVFSIIYAFVALANALHLAFVAEPLTIFWSKHEARRIEFLSDAIILNTVFAGCVCIIAVIVLALFKGGLEFREISLVIVFSVSMSFFWFFRQVSYASMLPWSAVAQTAIYSIVLISGTVFLKLGEALSIVSVLLMMTASAVFTAGWYLWIHRQSVKLRLSEDARDTVRECLSYARWSVPSAIVMWLAGNVFIIAMPFVSGLEETARLKALLTILLPFQQAMLALSLVMLPALALASNKHELAPSSRVIFWFFLSATTGAFLFSMALSYTGEFIYGAVYGAQYSARAADLRFGLWLPGIWTLATLGWTILRARRDPISVFKAYMFGLLGGGVIALPVVAAGGATGALIAMTTLYGLTAITLIWFVLKNPKKAYA